MYDQLRHNPVKAGSHNYHTKADDVRNDGDQIKYFGVARCYAAAVKLSMFVDNLSDPFIFGQTVKDLQSGHINLPDLEADIRQRYGNLDKESKQNFRARISAHGYYIPFI